MELTKEKRQEISVEIISYICDISDIDINKTYTKFTQYLGNIACFVDFSTAYSEFKQDFIFYLKEIFGHELKVDITKIEQDKLEFNINNQKIICYIDDLYLVVEWYDFEKGK